MWNFNEIFKPFEPDWEKVILTDNPPCANCKHKVNLRELHPGNTWDSPEECNHCVKRFDYLTNCLRKLVYLEKKQKEKNNARD